MQTPSAIPIVVTEDLLRKIAWGTNQKGPFRKVQRNELYLHGTRICKGETLECGHIVIPMRGGAATVTRRCPLCYCAEQLSTRGIT